MSERRATGVILSCDVDGRGFGFISSPGFEHDVFYHIHSVVDRGVAHGQQVSFLPVANPPHGWKATDIRIVQLPMQELPVADRSEKLGR